MTSAYPLRLKKLAKTSSRPVVGVVPLDERVVIPSVNRGVPFMIDNKTQPSSKAVFSLAEVHSQAN
jgi:septum formation inhibitor-activating ATPase MinD